MVVPTQLHIRPQDVALLQRCGMAALMVGAVVTGDTPQSLFTAIGAYRRAIDAL